MDPRLVLAASIAVLVGLAHTVLGERYILVRLFRRDLPKLFGSDWFTRRTLRFAWHITTLLLWGMAAVMIVVGVNDGPALRAPVLLSLAATFTLVGLVALVASAGRHLSWIAFLTIAALCWAAA